MHEKRTRNSWKLFRFTSIGIILIIVGLSLFSWGMSMDGIGGIFLFLSAVVGGGAIFLTGLSVLLAVGFALLIELTSIIRMKKRIYMELTPKAIANTMSKSDNVVSIASGAERR